MDSSSTSSTGELSQQALKLIMSKLQDIQNLGETDRHATFGNTKLANGTLTTDHILHEIQKLGDTMSTLIKTNRDLTCEKVGNKPTANAGDVNNGNVPHDGEIRPKLYLSTFPPEIRHMIYEYAFPERLLMFHPEGPVLNLYIGMKPLPPPAIALTCREAYYFSRKRYQQLNYNAVDLEWRRGRHAPQLRQHDALPHLRTWFNPDRDVLLIDLDQVTDDALDVSFQEYPDIYNPSKDLSWVRGPQYIRFSQIVRSLWPFTTIAKHVLLRPGPDAMPYNATDLFMYGFSDAFPSLQQISLVTHEFLWPHTTSSTLDGLLGFEGSAGLIDTDRKAQTDQVTSMLRTHTLANSTRDMMAWNHYLDELRDPRCRWNPLIQIGNCLQKNALEAVQSHLAEARLYAETAYHIIEGDRHYEAFVTWVDSLAPRSRPGFKTRLDQIPTVRAACLVMKPAWVPKKVVTDPQNPSETEWHWVRQ